VSNLRRTLLAGVLLLAACASPLDPRYLRLVRMPAPGWLPVPVDGVAPGELRSTWGDARSGGRSHQGLDILAPRGTPVRSTTEGLVSGLADNRLGGRVVWVTGPAGWRHYYAHLDRRARLREGQWVERGALLGWVGNSGNAAGGPTHLHYGIYPEGGGVIDPFPLLTRRR
jgi:peptidoglycan LD-endopeptidase LytH